MGEEPELGQPLDLRRLRYFVAVAEELHFGRAAERLYLAQPVLSRHVQKLELELGVELLKRNSRHVELTPAGERLLEEARQLLAAADAASRRMRGVASAPARLTIGFFVGDTFTAAVRAFLADRPEAELSFLRIYWHDQVEVLRDGRADVAFVHLPVDESGLVLTPVRAEPRLAVLPADHPLAQRATVSITELADDPVIRQAGADPTWEAFHNVDPRPDGRHPRPGPEVHNIEEKLEQVAAGRAISFVPASAAAMYGRPGVVYVPVDDIPPIQICLASPAGRRSSLVADFVAAVEATVSGHADAPVVPHASTTDEFTRDGESPPP
jgi:DNA-binding transcriptional LysR family regulator